MPDSLSQRLSDQLTRRDVDLLRLAAGDERRMEAEVEALGEELVRRLVRSDPTAVGQGPGQARLDTVIAASVPVIRDTYRALYGDMRGKLLEVMAGEADVMRRALSVSLDVSDGTSRIILGENVPRATMRDIIDNRVISANANDAETMRGFFEREAASHHRRYSGALRQAFSQDETLSQMMTRLREVTDTMARESTAVIRTGYNHVISQVRIEMMQRNSLLFKGAIWISRLDSRTSPICRALSNGMWDLNTGRPLPGSAVSSRFPGPPPKHFNERSQLHPLTRTVAEMEAEGDPDVQKALASLTDEQRRLLSPDPPADESYSEWLRRQSAAVQNEVLGPTRRKLWLDGKLTLQEMVTQRGRPLTLEQLRRKVQL